jgi:hypothetical protein
MCGTRSLHFEDADILVDANSLTGLDPVTAC